MLCFCCFALGFGDARCESKQTITDAVVAWRTMAKTLYELKKSGDAPVELKDIVANIVLPSGRSEAASSPSGSREKVNSPCKRKLTLDEVVDMFPSPAGKGDSVESSQGGSSEVELQEVICNCPECQAKRLSGQDRPAIPSSSKGGQRKETVKPTTRIRGKKSIRRGISAMKKAPMKKAKSKAQSTGSKTKTKPRASQAIAPPCKLVKRVKDGAAYILAKDKVYVASASDRIHGPKYLEGMKSLVKEIEKGEITTKTAAKEFLANFFQA